MALSNDVRSETSGGAIGQYKLVKVSGANVVVTTAATERTYGASQADAVDSGEIIPITLAGRVKLKAGGTIAKGAQIMPAADGEVVTFATGTGVFICGYALEAGVDGQVIECFLTPGDLGVPA